MKIDVLMGANLVGDITAAIAVKSAVGKGTPIRDNTRLLKIFPELAASSE
ncbi:MAG: hypothetical protein KKH41_08200 [Candidatus Thermoplasmatota archaeon]|nr:hypothetical protein [Candidatus Thermoplasmatota archaeon]MBU4072097.1 hypothetical protein [Candidatus Thermoplasmatota archaeon]MBU4143940.1 hypothetical protein [Candidatus Thermoplasmatota archaeon]MBU4592547.1 hypothetical protein [Candidatus Thermoplasmatota archaeon]